MCRHEGNTRVGWHRFQATDASDALTRCAGAYVQALWPAALNDRSASGLCTRRGVVADALRYPASVGTKRRLP